MSGIEDRIAEVLGRHAEGCHTSDIYEKNVHCHGCNFWVSDHAAHLAAAVVAELGLTEEWNIRTDMGVTSHKALLEHNARRLAEKYEDMQAMSRWVTGWEKAE